MKKFYSLAIFTIIVNLLITTKASAQTNTWDGSSSSNWNTDANWSLGHVPLLAEDVVIPNGITTTITVNTAAVCNSFTMSSGGNANTVSISGSNSLTVTNGVSVGAGTGTGDNKILAVGAGSLSCASISITATGNSNRTSAVTVSTGTVTVSGNITLGDANDDFTFSGSGTLNVGGSFSGGSFTASTSTVNYDGTTQTIRAVTYNNLKVSNPGTKTISSNLTVNGNITIEGGSTLAVTANGVNCGGGLVTSGSGTANFTGSITTATASANTLALTASSVNISGTTTLALSGNITVDDNTGITINTNCNAASVTIVGGGNDNTLTINGSNTLNISGSVTINAGTNSDFNVNAGTLLIGGNLTLNGGTSSRQANLNITTGTTTVTGNIVFGGTIPSLQKIVFTGTGNLNAGNGFESDGTLTAGSGTVNYDRATAQTAATYTYNNLTLSNGGAKTVTGTTINGILSIQGTASASGTTPTFGANSTLEYKGSAAQTSTNVEFPSSNGPRNLTINNSNGVTLHAARSINGVLTLTEGILNTTSNLLTINAGGSSTGASDASFVNGPLKKSGNTDFSFPVGKTGVGYMKIDIASIANGTNDANTSFTAQYFRASAGTTFGTTGLSGLGLQGVSNCEYWTIDRIDAGNNATANITMYWNAHSPCGSASYLVDPILGLKIAHFNTGTNQWDAIGGGAPSGNASAGSLTWSGASDFSPFALAALVGSNSPLPVMFADVKAYAKNNGVQIDWSNLTERDLTGYVVERSVDGKNFSDIAQYQPKSNMNDKAVYTSFDANPVAGSNFYRIRATEVGGKLIYSKILRVEMSGKQGFTMYPNPVIGKQLTINLTGVAQGSYNVRIINANGQDVYRKMLINSSSSTSEMIELPAAVKPGVYTMLISGDNFNATKMFVVQ